jgi:hypothetical protein
MTLHRIILAALLPLSLPAAAQLQEGKKNIEKLCGCFDVTFDYAETFASDSAYKFHPRESLVGQELVLPIETSDKKIVLQHLLLVSDTYIIKHWREDWSYETPVLYNYAGNKKWVKQELKPADIKGQWTQTVWETDDGPRYQGISTWLVNNHRTYWESTADAPLPRREYTTRNDYNILKRNNRIIITDSCWIHEQDNDKVIRTGATDKLLAQEKGLNKYVRVKDNQCAAARTWWEKNGPFWTAVRQQWQEVINNQTSISLKAKVENKSLTDYLTALWKDWSDKKITTDQAGAKAKTFIQQFMSAGTEAVANK